MTANRRLVLCVRVTAPAAGRGVLARLRALDARASARGGVVVAWSASHVAFAFEPDSIADAIALLATPGHDTEPGEPAFAGGLAEGELVPLAEDGSRGDLAWGPPLVVATAFARAARSGELACAEDVTAVRSLAVLSSSRVRARDGATRLRGVRVPLAQPWREHAALQLSRLRVPPLVGIDAERVPVTAGALTLVRADAGLGGSRLLQELASHAPRALVLSPYGDGLAPMGALRRAVERSITHDLGPKLVALAEPLDALLSGEPVDVDTVATLVTAFFASRGGPRESSPPATLPPLVVVDDAGAVDPASLEAVARAVLRADEEGTPIAMLVRVGQDEVVPAALASISRAGELALAPLSAKDAASVVSATTSGALGEAACLRWAERAGGVPLAIAEAVQDAVARGLVAFGGEGGARETTRTASRGPVLSPAEWIARRTQLLEPMGRAVVAVVALLGGEARLARISRVLEEAGVAIDLDRTVEVLVRDRWLLDVQEDWVGLPSRTHVQTIPELVAPDERRAFHAAITNVLRESEGAFGRAEAARHAASDGDPRLGARIALAAARAAAAKGLEASTTKLVALARALDPESEEQAREALAAVHARAPSGTGARAPLPSRGTASEKLLAAVPSSSREPSSAREPSSVLGGRPATPGLPFTPMELPASIPPQSARASEVAEKLAELAREAIRSADPGGLERWVEEVQATGDKPLLAERMRAIARVGRGDIGDALRVLRRTRDAIPAAEHALRCQTSLALGVTLAVGGRPAEALLEGLDALARAREGGDERGVRACLAFLAKLYASIGRTEDAARLGAPP